MKKISLFHHLIISLFFSFTSLQAQNSSYDVQVQAYIDKYKDIVIRDMKIYGIPASIKLAQAIVESRAGQSTLATEANNHFGIKCQPEWTGKTYTMDDEKPGECFRKYDNAEQSFHDHSEFLSTRDRYKFLFSIDVRNYEAWAFGLKSAGYATNPDYPGLLIRTIERFSLYQYDLPEEAIQAVAITQADNNLLDAYRSMFTYFAPGPNGRKVYLNNHLQCTFALAGDGLLKIAGDFRIPATHLLEYNDLSRAGGIKEGQVVYLEPKKRKALQDIHVVGLNQTLWEISQVFGIRLKSLLNKNDLPEGFQPPAGKMLRLR
ncbi:MAG: glucosaminidase domain-containing protein [bacterium]